MCVCVRDKKVLFKHLSFGIVFLWMRLLLLIFWHKCSVMFTILIYGWVVDIERGRIIIPDLETS